MEIKIIEKRFTDYDDASREMTTRIFFGDRAYIRGQYPNGRGFTVVITKFDTGVSE